MLDNIIRWHGRLITENPYIFELECTCKDLTMKQEMLSKGYCFAKLAKNTKGNIVNLQPLPDYDMEKNRIRIAIYIMFGKEEDMHNYIEQINEIIARL